jgi:protein ImuB
MMRIVSVWLPDLPIERLRRDLRHGAQKTASMLNTGANIGPNITSKIAQKSRSDSVPINRHPFALVATGARGRTITAVNGSAQAEGIYVGQRLADARAALPILRTGIAAVQRDQEALLNITQWAGRYGPSRNVELGVGKVDGFWIDITGVAHLFGGEVELLADLQGRVRAAGFTIRAAIADTPGAAFALCRYGLTQQASTLIAQPGTLRAALAPLTVEALRLDVGTVQLLQRLGLRRIGQLYDIPRPALAQRFRAQKASQKWATGQAEAVLSRLDQALGEAQEPLAPLVVMPPLMARRIFADPLITAAGVDDTAAQLASEVCEALDHLAKGGRMFTLRLYRADGSCAVVQARTSQPCRQVAHLLRLLSEKLSALDLGFGVDAATLEASELGDLGLEQGTLTGGDLRGDAERTGHVAALIDRLSNRLGQGRVFALGLQPSHSPERAERRIPAMPATAAGPAAGVDGRSPARPAFLLSPPEPVAVDEAAVSCGQGAPDSFVWRRLRHRVAKAEGPERIAPEWWRYLSAQPGQDRHKRTRDYYRLEDTYGGRYWLFREGSPHDDGSNDDHDADNSGVRTHWYMHGFFG